MRLGRRLFLLAVIAAAFVMLAFPLTAGMQSLFARDGYEGLTIAVVGQGGEGEALASFAGNLADVAAYCRFTAAGEDEAMEQLARGEVTAVLVLPPHFVDSILTGENESAVLHLNPKRPAESLLTLYAGRCASDMLSAAQGGIYAVLDALDDAGISRENAVYEINMEYIRFTMSRGNLYETETVNLSGAEPIGEHYVRSALAWLLTAAGTLFFPVLSTRQGAWRNRLKSAGCTGTQWALGALLPVLLCEVLLAAVLCIAAESFAVAGCLCCALYACGVGSLICILCPGEVWAGAGLFAFSTAAAFLSGGIVPPMLLPRSLRDSALVHSFSLLRRCLGGEASIPLALTGAVLLVLSFLLLRRSFDREGRA